MAFGKDTFGKIPFAGTDNSNNPDKTIQLAAGSYSVIVETGTADTTTVWDTGSADTEIVFTLSDTRAEANGLSGFYNVRGTEEKGGKRYFRVEYDEVVSGAYVGVWDTTKATAGIANDTAGIGATTHSVGVGPGSTDDLAIWFNNTEVVSWNVVNSLTAGDFFDFAIDFDNELVWARHVDSVNGAEDWNGNAAADPETGANGASCSGLDSTGYMGASLAIGFSGTGDAVILDPDVDLSAELPSWDYWDAGDAPTSGIGVLTLTYGHVATLGAGSYTLSGQALTLTWETSGIPYSLALAAGSYSQTGVAVGLTHAYAPIALNTGSYTYTGVSQNFYRGYFFPVAAGTYTLTGVSQVFHYGRSLALGAGSYTYTGKAQSFTYARTIALGAGSYTLSGQAVTLHKNIAPISLNAGSYTYTGVSQNFYRGRLFPLGAGSYTVTGVSVTLAHGYRLSLTAGNYTLTGVAQTFHYNRTINLNAGSYSQTGVALGLTSSRRLALAAGSYTLTGVALGLTSSRKITLTAGSYSLTGKDVTVNYDPAGNFTISLEQGAYSLTGVSVGVQHAYAPITLSSGSYTLSGKSVTLAHGYNLSLSAGSYTYSGVSVSLTYARTIALGAGSYTYTGVAQGLTRAYAPISLGTGSYTYTGVALNITSARRLLLGTGAYAQTGVAQGLTYARTLNLNTGSYVYTGVALGLVHNRTLALNGGSYAVTGQAVGLTYDPFTTDRTITLESGTYTLTGNSVTLHYNRTLALGAGSYSYLSGGDAEEDTTGNNDLTINGATATTGHVGGGLLFDGTNDWCDLPQAAVGAWYSNNRSVSVWFKTTDKGPIFGQTVTGQTPGSSSPGGYIPALYVDVNGKLRGTLFWHNAVGTVTSSSAYNDGNWHHAVITYNSGTETLYVDGSQVDQRTGLSQSDYGSGNYQYYIGAAYAASWPDFTTSGWDFFDGTIDDFRVYSVALSSSDVTALYNASSEPSGLQASYPMGGQAVTLTYAQNKSLLLDSGVYTVTGKDLTISRGITVSLGAGSYTYTGVAQDFVRTVGSNRAYNVAVVYAGL